MMSWRNLLERRGRQRGYVLVATLGAAIAGPAVAQQPLPPPATRPAVVPAAQRGSVWFSMAATAAWMRQDLVFLDAREAVQGPSIGGTAELRLGPLVLAGTGLRGRLEPVGGAGALSRDAGEVRGLVRLQPALWLGFEGSFTVRAFSSAAGYQLWQIPSGGIWLAPKLGHPALRAYVRAHYAPRSPQRFAAGQQSGDARWDLGLSGESGLIIAPGASGPLVTVSYRFERFDFPGGGSGRLDQFQTIAVSLGGRVSDGGGR